MAGPYTLPLIGIGVSDLYHTSGFAQLSNGSVTIQNRLVASTSRIFFTYAGMLTQPGYLYVDSIDPGISFTIKSTNVAGGDSNYFGWFFIYESDNSYPGSSYSLPILSNALDNSTYGYVQLLNGVAVVTTSLVTRDYPVILTIWIPSESNFVDPVYTVEFVASNVYFNIKSTDPNDNAILYYFVVAPAHLGVPEPGLSVTYPVLENVGTAMTYGTGILGLPSANLGVVNTTRADFSNVILLSVRQAAPNVLHTKQPYLWGFNPGVDFYASSLFGYYDGSSDFRFNWMIISPATLGIEAEAEEETP